MERSFSFQIILSINKTCFIIKLMMLVAKDDIATKKGLENPNRFCFHHMGTSINDVRRFSAIFDLPAMSDNFVPIQFNI